MEYKYLIFVAMALLLVAPVMAKGLDLGEIGNLLEKPELRTLEPKQVELTDRLDESYIVKEDGVYFKDLKQTDPIVWIDKKVKDIYHVDSERDFIENETVTLEFYYEIQPDWIAHYAHSGKFDRYYFPTQWDWTPDCDEEICDGGWVTFEVYNVEEGRGSSTFPISITGPTWAVQGQQFGEFDGIDGSSKLNISSLTNINQIYTYSVWLNPGIISQDGYIFSNDLNVRNSYLIDNNDNKIATQLGDPSQGQDMSNVFTTGEWNFLTIEFHNTSASEANVSLYFNSVLDKQFNISWNGDTTFGTLVLGMFKSGTSGAYNGNLDEITLYNRSLDQAEITALFNNYSVTSTGVNRTGTPSTDGLVLNINFDDYSVADLSGSGNHGTNTNVSFGVVENVLRTLTAITDYTINPTTGLFTIVNNDFDAAEMITSWEYSVRTSSTNASDSMLEQFATYPALIGLVGTIVFLGLIIVILILSFKGGSKP